MRVIGAVVLFLLATVLVVGCGGEDPFGELSGTVSYDGKPINDGAITFIPDNGPTAGCVIKDGRYVAKVALGPTKVKISGSNLVGHKKVYDTPDSPVMPVMAEVVPAKYNQATELRYDVQPGKQTKDFDLPK